MLLHAAPVLLLAALQAPARDSVPVDTLPRARLPALEVTVARSPAPLDRLPFAADVVPGDRIRLAQPTLGLDESLTAVPGVHVANRWNWSLDQRLSIRGFGSRAGFGVRGVRILLDGVPQTLPDGQSQLTNVDFATLERAEVLRSAASALYGNASGGAVLLTSQAAPDAPWSAGARIEAGAFAGRKWLARGGARGDRVAGTVVLSRFTTDGFRAHSRADLRQGTAALTWQTAPATTLRFRLAAGDTPVSLNPGALTATEAAATPWAASPNNVLRGADKRVTQQQASVALSHVGRTGWTLSAALFGLRRDLENPLATPPPGPFVAAAGTWNAIDRLAGGGRVELGLPLADRARVTLGMDAQAMRDDRENRRALAGVPTDSVLARQRERITELGPFAQLRWDPAPAVSVLAGLRYDRVRFRVADRHLTDGEDASGTRTMAEASGSLGGTVTLGAGASLYASAATAFETPTSTELVATPAGGVGLNPSLGPQRATSVELGARYAGPIRASIAAFRIRVRDAIVPARELDGRSVFTNAARVASDGLELGLGTDRTRRVSASLAYTFARYRYTAYRPREGTRVDTLDGRRLPGVPRHFARVTVEARPLAGLYLALDQLASSSLFGDDRNTLEADGWTVTNLRASWAPAAGPVRVAPFVAVQNLFGRRHVGSVTVNGAQGRVFEPSPGRWAMVGVELDWPGAPRGATP